MTTVGHDVERAAPTGPPDRRRVRRRVVIAAAPLHGQTVRPGSGQGDDDFGLEVVLPITLVQPGKHRISGTVVHYTVDGKAYRFTQPTDVVACTYACDARPAGR
jgi:hypothetical protein